MFSRDRPHRWSLLALSAALTGLLFWGFMLSSRLPDKPRQIYYVQSWMADRKDSDIIRKQITDLAAYEAGLVNEQGKFQRLADSLGIDWREDEARNRSRRQEALKQINAQLDSRLAKAEAGQQPATGAAQP